MSLQNLQAEFVELLASSEQTMDLVSPIQQMSVYRNNIESTLIRALTNAYPLIIQLVGEDFFRSFAKAYIQRYPSGSSDIHDYGEYVVDFLAEYAPASSFLYLPEVAKFEWACHVISAAAEVSAFDTHHLETINPEDYAHMHFMLHPASQLIHFQYPILDVIELCQGKVDQTIDINKGGVYLLIIRRELDIMLKPVSHAEFEFLSALQENQILSEALDAALKIDQQFQLNELLPAWIQNKTIVDCY